MTYTNASIRRAIAACGFNGRPIHIQAWSEGAVSSFGALYNRDHAESEAEARLFLAIDSVAAGIRWSEMTGRTQMAAFHQMPWKDTRCIVEAIVRLCLRTGNMSADFVKECWRELASLKAQHAAEAA